METGLIGFGFAPEREKPAVTATVSQPETRPLLVNVEVCSSLSAPEVS